MVSNFYADQTFELLLKRVQHYKETVKMTLAPETVETEQRVIEVQYCQVI
jgi:hypothetical protein